MSGGKVTIAVCTRNRRDLLARTLDSLAVQETPAPFTPEILIIDNGSTDGTADLVRSFANRQPYAVRYVTEDRIGVAAARNRAVNGCDSGWLAFIDDDETAEPDWLRALLETADKTGADVVGGGVRLALPECIGEHIRGTARKHLDETVERSGLLRRLTYNGPGTGNVLISRGVFDRIGMFDETLAYRGEDQDFFRRAAKAGFCIVRANDAVVNHHFPVERLTTDALIDTARTNGRSLAFFDARYEGRAYALGIALLRMVHAALVTLPMHGVSHLMGRNDCAQGYACSRATAAAYIGETIRLLSGRPRTSG